MAVGGMTGRGHCLALTIVAAGSAAALLYVGATALGDWFAPARPETIVSASLESLKEQNVLVPFMARYVADPTSRVRALGLTAQKTLIVPGTVRYQVDLGQLDQDDVRWDADAQTLSITLPPISLSDPEMDPAGAVEYRDGAFVMAVTDAETALDAANWKAAKAEILAQARAQTPMKLAETAARQAVARSFAMPLKAAGIDAKVTVGFAR
jgi:hypothetical protein